MNNTLPVANEILRQLGGLSKLSVMIGARNFVGAGDGLRFKIGTNAKRVAHVAITLTPMDTYEVAFFSKSFKKASLVTDVYADNLRAVIEQNTGMYLSL